MKKYMFFVMLMFSLFNCNAEELIYEYNPQITIIKSFDGNGEKYEGTPKLLKEKPMFNYVQPWNGYDPPFTKEDKSLEKVLHSQTHNIKVGSTYKGIEVEDNKWMKMACEEALKSVQNGGGPFGAVIVQIDDSTGKVLRYWKNHNHVVEWDDPTAHAEVSTIRAACKELGVFDLGTIKKENAKLPQDGATSHCVIYSSAEPCPMCYSAICWARIPVLIFAATRYDAAQQGVNFSDEAIYDELSRPYSQRSMMKVYQSTTDNSLDAFNHWKRSKQTNY